MLSLEVNLGVFSHMQDGRAPYDFLSGIEDTFDPRVYGRDIARLRPARQFVEIGETIIEPVRLHPIREPLTAEEAQEILESWAIKDPPECDYRV